MRNWMKQLGTVLSLVVTFCVSVTAYAYPPQCYDVCNCTTSCDMICYTGVNVRVQSTCGEDGFWCREMSVCGGGANQAVPVQDAQAQLEAQQQQDASLDVCTEQGQQSATSKS